MRLFSVFQIGVLIAAVSAVIDLDPNTAGNADKTGIREVSAVVEAAKLQRALAKNGINTGATLLPTVSDDDLNAFVRPDTRTGDNAGDYVLIPKPIQGWNPVTNEIMKDDATFVTTFTKPVSYNLEKNVKYNNLPVQYKSIGSDNPLSEDFSLVAATHTLSGIPVMATGNNKFNWGKNVVTAKSYTVDDGFDAIGAFYANIANEPKAKELIAKDTTLRGHLLYSANKFVSVANSRYAKMDPESSSDGTMGGVFSANPNTISANFATNNPTKYGLQADPGRTKVGREQRKATGHVRVYNAIARIQANAVAADPKGGEDISSCSGGIIMRKRRFSKRADPSCSPISGEDETSSGTVQSSASDDSVVRDEASAIYDIGQALNIPEIGTGYTGEAPSSDGSDSTELDHNFIFQGSVDMDDAVFKLKEAVKNKLKLGKFTDRQRLIFVRAMSSLDQTHGVRLANLDRDRNAGGISPDKQITAEGRLDFLNEVKSSYYDVVGKTVEEDNPDYKDVIGGSTDSTQWTIDDSRSPPMQDYKSPAEIRSIYDVDAVRTFMQVGDDSIGEQPKTNIGTEPVVKDGDEEEVDPAALVPGSTGYKAMWQKVTARTTAFLLKTGAKWQAKDRRLFRAGMTKWKLSIDAKRDVLIQKEKNGEDIKAEEIADYNDQHDAWKMTYDKAASMDMNNVGVDTGGPTDPAIRDLGYIPEIHPKMIFNTKAGKPSSTSTINVKNIPDSARNLGGKFFRSGRGTRGTSFTRPFFRP
jgi:hypothetical protein